MSNKNVPFPKNKPLLLAEDPLITFTLPSGATIAVANLPEGLSLIVGDKPKILLDMVTNQDGATGEYVDINDAFTFLNSNELEETLQKILFRVPELSENEKSKVYASECFSHGKQAVNYYFKLLNKLNLDTYLRD